MLIKTLQWLRGKPDPSQARVEALAEIISFLLSDGEPDENAGEMLELTNS